MKYPRRMGALIASGQTELVEQWADVCHLAYSWAMFCCNGTQLIPPFLWGMRQHVTQIELVEWCAAELHVYADSKPEQVARG